MTWATNSVSEAIHQLGDALQRRCSGQTIPDAIDVVRTPVALMFVRGDRAEPAKTLANQVVASYGYWDYASAEYIDLVFFGWYNDAGHVGFQPILKSETSSRSPTDTGMFIDCYREIERMSKWRYSGETDILLVDFEVRRSPFGGLETPGVFSFKNCIYLPVEDMVKNGRVKSLDELVQELVNAAKEVYDSNPHQATVFEISDRIGWTRGRKALWERLKHLFLRDWSKIYDELRPFAVCDLTV